MNAGIALDGAADHGVSEALYLRDPDGNGVELYWDRPMENWPRTREGGLAMFTKALDLDQSTTPNSAGQRLQRVCRVAGHIGGSMRHRNRRVQRRIAQRDHDAIKTERVEQVRSHAHTRGRRLGAVYGVEGLRKVLGRGRRRWFERVRHWSIQDECLVSPKQSGPGLERPRPEEVDADLRRRLLESARNAKPSARLRVRSGLESEGKRQPTVEATLDLGAESLGKE